MKPRRIGRGDTRRAREGRRRPRGDCQRERVGARRRRLVVRAGQPRPHRPRSPRRSATSRARPRSSRCACRSARRPCWSRSSAKACCAQQGRRARRQVAGDRGAGGRQLRAERLRLRARAARPRRSRGAGAVCVAEAICLSRRLLARPRRRSAGASATRARPRSSISPSPPTSSAWPRSRSGGATTTLNVKVTPERDVLKVRETARVAIEVTDATASPPRTARSRSPRSTKACSSSWTTPRGTSSTG